jgi:LysM repeat protein
MEVMRMKMIKKSLLLALVTVCVLFIAGCPPPPPPPPPPAQKPPAPPPVEEPAPVVENNDSDGIVLTGASYYTVVSGDTLANITAAMYGGTNMFFFPLIRLANSGSVSNPDLIEPGTNLVIPPLQANLNSRSASALIKTEMQQTASQYDGQGKTKAAGRLRNLANRLK